MRWISAAALGLTLATSGPLSAQRSALREVHSGGNGAFGVNIVIGEPLGTFRQTGNTAAGLGIFGVTSGRPLGVRIEGSWMVYDANYQGYGVSTTSQIGSLMVGPQVTLGQGPMRLYGFATLGGSLFWTDASYSDGCGCSSSDFLDGDFTTTRSVGAGLLLGLSAKRTPIAMDFGVRETRHDRVTYVPSGGLTDNGNGTFTADRVTTPVLMRVWQLGISIGIR